MGSFDPERELEQAAYLLEMKAWRAVSHLAQSGRVGFYAAPLAQLEPAPGAPAHPPPASQLPVADGGPCAFHARLVVAGPRAEIHLIFSISGTSSDQHFSGLPASR